MQVNLGEKIRQLRKSFGKTQEDIAAALGVTAQAVSRWESGGGFPDISMLPSIAHYFGVSIDELFEYDSDRQKRIDEALQKIRTHKIQDKPDKDILPFIRNACAEFPGNDELKFELADSLYKMGWSERGSRCYNTADDIYIHVDVSYNQNNEYWQESIKLFNSLLDTTRDDKIRMLSKQNLVYVYSRTGQHDEAVAIANTFPDMCICRESLLSNACDGKEYCKYNQEYLLASIDSLYMAFVGVKHSRVSGLTGDGNYDTELALKDDLRAVEMLKKVQELYSFVFDYGNMGVYHRQMSEIYIQLVAEYSKIADNPEITDPKAWLDKIFEALDNALYHAKRFDGLDEEEKHKCASFWTDHITFNTESMPHKPFAPDLPNNYRLSNNSKLLTSDPRWDEWVRKTKEP